MHAGGNDIGKVRTVHLLAVICFSEMVQRLAWAMKEATFFNKIRKRMLK